MKTCPERLLMSVITRVLEGIEGTFIVVLSTAVEPGLYAMHTTNKLMHAYLWQNGGIEQNGPFIE